MNNINNHNYIQPGNFKIRRKKSPLTSSTEDLVLDIIIYTALTILFIVTIYPFLNILAISLNDAIDSNRGSIYLLPRDFTWYNYEYIFKTEGIFNAAFITVARTVIGTITQLFVTTIAAYILSRREFMFRKFLTKFLIITMYFNAGIIPVYILYRQLGLTNSFLAYIIPTMLYAMNVVIIRSFIDKIPDSLMESAKIDGAGEVTVLFKIVIPLALPAIATIALFVAVWHWNDWFFTFIYNSGRKELSTLQYELMGLLQNATSNISSGGQDFSRAQGGGDMNSNTPQSIRATMTIVATVPILIVYPFLQRYFVTGLTLGGVKE